MVMWNDGSILLEVIPESAGLRFIMHKNPVEGLLKCRFPSALLLVPREDERERSHIIQNNLKYKTRAGETVQQLRLPLVAFVKDLDSVPSTYMAAQLPITCVSGDPMLSSDPLGICMNVLHSYTLRYMYTRMCAHTHYHYMTNTSFKNVHQE